MSAKLSFKDVSYPDFFKGFSCEIQAGCSALIVTSKEAESNLLARLITGFSCPSLGSVNVNNQEVAKLGSEQLYQLRQQIAIVPSDGGLVSNLKIWENITLPLMYHSGEVTLEEEETAYIYLSTLGYSGNVMALPAHLSLYEKYIVALVRAFLSCPRIIVYNNCFEDASSLNLKIFSRLTAEFHSTRDDRISLYLSSSADVAADLTVDMIIQVHEPAETVSRIR
jgi:phospholipid/cholesterol/gamma-HCH transport system ATP-binding protein